MTIQRTLVLCLVLAGLAGVARAEVAFQDDFNRADNTDLNVNGPAGQPWTEVESHTGAWINGNLLRMNGGSFSGRGYTHQNASNFAAGYDATLENNLAPIEWSFNMRVNGANPSGYNLHANSPALVLGNTDATYATGDGYAVIYDNDNNDALTLARFTGGVDGNANFTPLGTAAWDHGDADAYFSVRVTYDPSSDDWELFATSSTSGFSDPAAANVSRGTASDDTYTGEALDTMGTYFGHSASAATYGYFDSMTVQVVPEPASLILLTLGAATLVRRSRNGRPAA